MTAISGCSSALDNHQKSEFLHLLYWRRVLFGVYSKQYSRSGLNGPWPPQLWLQASLHVFLSQGGTEAHYVFCSVLFFFFPSIVRQHVCFLFPPRWESFPKASRSSYCMSLPQHCGQTTLFPPFLLFIYLFIYLSPMFFCFFFYFKLSAISVPSCLLSYKLCLNHSHTFCLYVVQFFFPICVCVCVGKIEREMGTEREKKRK